MKLTFNQQKLASHSITAYENDDYKNVQENHVNNVARLGELLLWLQESKGVQTSCHDELSLPHSCRGVNP